MLITTEVFDSAALAAQIAAATILGADLEARLYTNVPTISKQNVIADFTEATYAGYAAQAVVLGAPFRDPQNGISALAAPLTWQETVTPSSVIIKGIFYVFGAGPALLGAELFPNNGIPLNDLLDSFQTILEYIQSNAAPGFTTIIR